MKKLVCILLVAAAFFVFAPTVHAEESLSFEEIYGQQAQESGADDLPDALPQETRNILDELGVGSTDWQSVNHLSAEGIFDQIRQIAGEKGNAPLRASFSVLAVMLLCALLNGMKLSFGDRPLGGVVGMAGTLCICTVVVTPIVSCIANAAAVIKGAAGFLLACVPVLTGIMVAGGQVVSAGTYNLLMVGAGNTISIIAAVFLVPLLNIFLAFSIVSAVSPSLNLSGLCGLFGKAVKWVLGFCMTVFTSLLTVQSVVSAAADSTTTRAAKFMISSFVPVVGSALGDALNTVQGCVKLLKSGVGAFGLIAGAFIFLPVIVECLMWMLTLTVCAGIGDIFELKEITTLLRSASKVVETMFAIVLCCMTILMVSTVLMLVIGGGSA